MPVWGYCVKTIATCVDQSCSVQPGNKSDRLKENKARANSEQESNSKDSP